MNFKNKLHVLFIGLISLLILPFNVFAYSDYVIPGGENIGIQVNSNGILIVGFYEVNNQLIGKDSGFVIGDKIVSINNQTVNNIQEMANLINDNINETSTIEVGIMRDNKEKTLSLTLTKDENNIYKTGLYVKDQINGIGTLTYIDPETKIFGGLGHEIMEKSTGLKFEIKDGKIFKATVTDIERSNNGSPGEKKAQFFKEDIYGDISENENSGIFGTYTDTLPNKKLYKVAKDINEIKTGPAIMQTSIKDNVVESFAINIIKIDKQNQMKNILFEITDENLLAETGGVVQGMSGSPILQDNKLIGAVTHVIVNDSTKGYGIFITKMLEEGEQ